MDVLIGVFACVSVLIGMVVVGILVCLTIDRFRFGPAPTDAELAEAQHRHEQRLLTPNWLALEEHFGAPIPRPIRTLYANHELLLQKDFSIRPPQKTDEADDWYVLNFEPADLDAINDVCLVGQNEPVEVAERRFPFACDGCGNFYFVEISHDSSSQSPVFFADHDGGEIYRVADSFTEFVSWPRRYERAQAAPPLGDGIVKPR